MPVAVMRGCEMRLLGRVVVLLVAASCSDGTGLSTEGTLALTVAPATISLEAGASGPATVTITRGGGFTGAVTLTESGAPLGITVSFSPVSVAAGATASTVDVGVDAAVAPGTYAITLSAAGTDVTTATATLTVIVIQPGASGSVALSVTPSALTVTAGGPAATSQIEVARTVPFAGAVALTATVTGAPTGVTATIDPQSVAPGSTTATVSVQAAVGAAAGTTPIVIRATGTGVTDATTTVNVTVNIGSGTTVAFCAADAPVWVAVQDGSSGAWTRINPTSGSTYNLSFPSGRGGIATVDTVGSGTAFNVIYGTAAEFTSFASAANVGRCPSKSVNGSVANVGVTQIAQVALGYSQAIVIPAISTTFQLAAIAEGPQDLVAARSDPASATDAIILRRDVDVPDNGTLPVLDFNAPEALAPATGNVAVSNIGSDDGIVQTVFYGVAGSAFGVLGSATGFTSTSGAKPYQALPLASLEPGEVQLLTAFAANGTATRTAGRFFRSPVDYTIVLGPTLSTPTVTKAAATPYARPRVQLASQAEYNRTVMAFFSQSGLDRTVNLTATSGYFGGAPTTWDVTVPDLSAVTGWDNAWGLQDGTGIDWTVSTQGGSIALFDPSITEGATQQSASSSSSSPLLSMVRRPAR